jgi:site-specific recombinase XerD
MKAQIHPLPTGSQETLADLAPSFRRHLQAENKAPRTVQGYQESLNALEQFLIAKALPTEVGSLRREHLEAFVADLLTHAKATTASNRYRALQQFFKWAASDDLIVRSPMEKMRPPKVPEYLPQVLREQELQRLMRACEGSGYRERRDMALLMMFIDTGCRLDEITRLQLTRDRKTDGRESDIDLDNATAIVLGKGRRPRLVGLGRKTVRALDRYIRLRAQHPHADAAELWLGTKGKMTTSGVAQTVEARGLQAKLTFRLHPHAFRHYWSHSMKTANASDEDVMTLAGWKSHQMLQRYGKSAATERALETHRRLSPGDRL